MNLSLSELQKGRYRRFSVFQFLTISFIVYVQLKNQFFESGHLITGTVVNKTWNKGHLKFHLQNLEDNVFKKIIFAKKYLFFCRSGRFFGTSFLFAFSCKLYNLSCLWELWLYCILYHYWNDCDINYMYINGIIVISFHII